MGGSRKNSFDETAAFRPNFDFFAFSGVLGVRGTCVFFRAPKRVKFAIFLILPDPGCRGDPQVGFHSDCVVSWYGLGAIEALFWIQGPL